MKKIVAFLLLPTAYCLLPTLTLAQGTAGPPATFSDLEGMFQRIVGSVLFLAAIVLFVMFVIGGFRYITSAGDPKAAEGAKGTLTHAILGLAVLILAFVVLLIVEKITGVKVTQFKVTN